MIENQNTIAIWEPNQPVELAVNATSREIAERAQLRLHVVHAGADHHPQERQTLELVHAAGDAEVEQADATVGHHEQVAAVQVAVE